VTVATVLVIGTRERMHSFARLIPQDEVLTAGKFLILVGIILPLIPDTRLIAPAVTPYHIWLAVIAISGLSYSTYLVQRYRPIKGGALLPALLGGAYSSTATTVVLAKRQREAGTRRPGRNYCRYRHHVSAAHCVGCALQPIIGSQAAAHPKFSLYRWGGVGVVGMAED
jgi:uncharacterized membrane protein (DUF4010 family)